MSFFIFTKKITSPDINECLASPCDSASTECVNTPGSFYCQCKGGFTPSTDCRPVGDLGLATSGILDKSIMVSATEEGYNKAVVTINEHKKGFRL